MKALPVEKFSDDLQSILTNVCDKIVEYGRSVKQKFLRPTTVAPKKNFAFLEPRVESNFNPERKSNSKNKGTNREKQKLMHKYKREMRGAVRELRRDALFLNRQQLQDQMERDAERKRKTKNLMASLMGQEAEYKKYKRAKK